MILDSFSEMVKKKLVELQTKGIIFSLELYGFTAYRHKGL